MPLFLLVYIIIAVIVSAVIFLLAFFEKDRKPIKIAMIVIYIVSILGIIFATGYLENELRYSKLITSILALAIVALMYGADSLGGLVARKREG